MRKGRWLVSGLVLGAGAFAVVAYAGKASKDIITPQEARKYFSPITQKVVDNPQNPVTQQKVELGRMLYHDPRLSKSGLISCNTCHNLASGGVDNLPTSIGHKWQMGPVNAPTVYNAAFHIAQFWDGRAKDLEEQAKGPILNPKEMAMPSEEEAVKRIASIPQYRELFAKAFPGEKEPITYDNIAKAIAAFERTLLTPSRFDKFLMGDTKALTAEEKKGLKLFIEKGCASCHNGVALGGTMFQKMGIVKPYNSTSPAKGRYDVTKKPEDMYVFKVPSLRNVERTAPYFHDGQVWSLEEAVRIMADIQLGVQLKDDEVRAIVAFLKSLNGEIPKHALTLPVLPPSTEKTPKPSFD
ncbi:MAG: cytochrome-c peroxidase [Aquificota bacterium]|jgi:cytochrome c peroxidase|nr:cytochrome-c peroxidase [Aquificaceae bacterium]QWK12336.1 MAG: cytochrome-c peroxidase [Aquificota bacterium]HCO39254.1 cytochrome-c peroxidase [Aquificaceae bacterium]